MGVLEDLQKMRKDKDVKKEFGLEIKEKKSKSNSKKIPEIKGKFTYKPILKKQKQITVRINTGKPKPYQSIYFRQQ